MPRATGDAVTPTLSSEPGRSGALVEEHPPSGPSLPWLSGQQGLILAAFGISGLSIFNARNGVMQLVACLGIIAFAVIGARSRGLGSRILRAGTWCLIGGFMALGLLVIPAEPGLLTSQNTLAVGMFLAILALLAEHRRMPVSRWLYVGFLAFWVLSRVILIRRILPHIDVVPILGTAAHAVMSGQNPYTTLVPNLYTAEETLNIYGPSQAGSAYLPVSFPYPPINAILAVIGYVLSDVRTTGIILLAVASAAVALTVARGVAWGALLLLLPSTTAVVVNGWTESAPVALGALAVCAVAKKRPLITAGLFAAVLVTKQYFVVALPVVWMTRTWLTVRRAAVGVITAAVLVLPWYLANPAAFYYNLFGWRTSNPLRTDSISLPIAWLNLTGIGFGDVFRFGSIAVGFAIAVACCWRMRPTPRNIAIAISFSLLGTFLLTDTSAPNYFYLVAGGLLIAASLTQPPDESGRARDLRGETSSEKTPAFFPLRPRTSLRGGAAATRP